MKTEEIKKALIEGVLLENKKNNQSRVEKSDEFSRHIFEAMQCNDTLCDKPGENLDVVGQSNLGEVLINAKTIKGVQDIEGQAMNVHENDFSIIEESLNHIEQFVSELGKPDPNVNIIKSIFSSFDENMISRPELRELMEEMKIAAYTEYIKWKRGDYL